MLLSNPALAQMTNIDIDNNKIPASVEDRCFSRLKSNWLQESTRATFLQNRKMIAFCEIVTDPKMRKNT